MRFYKPEGSLMVKILRNTVLVLFLIVFISILYNFRNKESDTECALIAEATASEEFRGVFIRDEQQITYSGAGVLSYNVADGGKLGNGSIIADVYTDDSQISRSREIEKLTGELEILEKIQNPGTIESAQPAGLSEKIEENYRSLMYCRDMRDYDSLASVKDTLLVQMSTYQIITDEVEDFSQQIADINSQLAALRQQSSAPIESIKSDRSAYFVSYCDGYESLLNSSMIDTLTIAQINSVTDSRSDEKNIVGKLVDGYCWYLAGIVDNSRKQYEAGDTVWLRVGSSADMFKGEVRSIRDEGDPAESIIIIECSRFSKELVQHRTENIELTKDKLPYKGLRVPREAIVFKEEEALDENGTPTGAYVTYKGVNILKGEQVEFKKIDVIYEGSGYVLSAIHTEDPEYLALYDDILIEGEK